MKTITTLLILFAICSALSSCGNYVETEYEKGTGTLCNNLDGGCIVTFVWADNDIEKSFFDNPDSLKSINLHKAMADSTLKHILINK